MVVNRINRYCWTLQIAEASECMTEFSPTFSITFWKAVGAWRVTLHKACGEKKHRVSDDPEYNTLGQGRRW
jgi:hypothetical protein